MTTDPLEIKLAVNLPRGVVLISSALGVAKIKELSAFHGLEAKLELELRLFAAFGLANLGNGAFIYSQLFGSTCECVGLVFLCGPAVRTEFMFVFGTKAETDAQVDQFMEELEPILETIGIAYYRAIAGDATAAVHIVDSTEIQMPFLLAKSRN
jgi:hypothetical protein